MAKLLLPLPAPNSPYTDNYGLLTQWAYQYFNSLDLVVRGLVGGGLPGGLNSPQVGPLVDAIDDATAAAAGVPVNGLYRNGTVVLIRVA